MQLNARSSSFLGATGFQGKRAVVSQRASVRVQMAITREKKERIVSTLKGELSRSLLTVNLKYQGLTVKEIQDFKRKLPADAKLIVAKNSLVKRAANEVEGWSSLAEVATGDSAWFFVGENVADSVKVYQTFVEKLEKDGKKGALSVQGAVLDGRLVPVKDFAKLKDLPSRKELMAKIAIMINKVPTRVASSIAAVPRKVARAVKEVSAIDEDKTKLVSEFVGRAKPESA